MRIVQQYSHLNGFEYLAHRKPHLWKEIETAIAKVDASIAKTKVSKEVRTHGTSFYSPTDMNAAFKREFEALEWQERRTSYWVTHDDRLIRKTLNMSADDQKHEIEAAGLEPIPSYNQTDFVKDRVAVEVQLGKYSFVAYDLFVKHMAFYIGDVIDLGVEILPMKELQREMSSGPGYYEGEL